jgi:hypothetical protein
MATYTGMQKRLTSSKRIRKQLTTVNRTQRGGDVVRTPKKSWNSGRTEPVRHKKKKGELDLQRGKEKTRTWIIQYTIAWSTRARRGGNAEERRFLHFCLPCGVVKDEWKESCIRCVVPIVRSRWVLRGGETWECSCRKRSRHPRERRRPLCRVAAGDLWRRVGRGPLPLGLGGLTRCGTDFF